MRSRSWLMVAERVGLIGLVGLVGLVGLGGLVGCRGMHRVRSDEEAAFDNKWRALRASAEPLVVEADFSPVGFRNEARRATVDSRGESPALPGPLPDGEAARIVRQNLPALQACIQLEQRAGTLGSGKAIVTLEIEPNGAVTDVKIEAPSFSASHLIECLTGRARSWVFPRFGVGPKRFSYPIVFVSG